MEANDHSVISNFWSHAENSVWGCWTVWLRMQNVKITDHQNPSR